MILTRAFRSVARDYRIWLAFVAALLSQPALAQGPATVDPAAEKTDTDKAPAQQAEPLGSKWVRVVLDENEDPIALQTATVRYTGTPPQGGKPASVDLVGAIHVGDAAYYADLNKRFKQYQALLYELVAPEGTRIPKGAKADKRHPLGAVQGGMKDMLGLEHQLEKVDYTRPNFVHADMSPDEFFKTMEKRGEGVAQMLFKLIGQGIAEQSKQQAKGKSSDAEILMALFSRDRPRRLKIAFAKQFDQMESMLTSFGGPDGSTIIQERNKKALEVLGRELKAGKTNIGIFYGAGHLVDMHQRMVKEFKLQPERIQWHTAWDLK